MLPVAFAALAVHAAGAAAQTMPGFVNVAEAKLVADAPTGPLPTED